MNNIDLYLSRKLRCISAVAALAVVSRHSSIDYSAPASIWFKQLFSEWAVPWYFLVAGFFFTQSISRNSPFVFWKKKINGLLAPLLIFSALGAVVNLNIKDLNFLSVWGINNHGTPAGNTSLWFVYTLIAYTVFGSCAYWISKRFVLSDNKLIRVLCFAVSFCCCLFLSSKFKTIVHPQLSFPHWFLLGCFINQCGLHLVRLQSKRANLVAVGLSLCVLIICDMVFYRGEYSSVISTSFFRILSALVLVWYSYDLIVFKSKDSRCSSIPVLLEGSFFIYLSHMLYIGFFKKIWVWVFGRSEFGDACAMVIIAIVAYFVGWSLSRFMRGYLPRVYSFMIGGR